MEEGEAHTDFIDHVEMGILGVILKAIEVQLIIALGINVQLLLGSMKMNVMLMTVD